jgi:hypothetical protein
MRTLQQIREAVGQTGVRIHPDAVPTPPSTRGQLEAGLALGLGLTAGALDRAIEAAPSEALRRHWRAQHGSFVEELRRPLVAPLGIRRLLEVKHGRSWASLKEAVVDTAATAESLANVLNRIALPVWMEAVQDYGAWAVAMPIAGKDFRPHPLIAYGETPTPMVTAQNTLFPARGVMPEVEAATVSVSKRPEHFEVTMEAVANDDMRRVGEEVRSHVRAYARAQAQAIVNVLAANPVYGGDGVALFHASRGNLMTGGALTVTTARAAVDALGAIAPLGGTVPAPVPQGPGSLLLLVPPSLEGAATIVNESKGTGGGLENRFRVVVSPLLSGTGWYIGRLAPTFPTVGLVYLDELEPQILQSGSWIEGQLFRNDAFSYVVKHTYNVAPIEFRHLVKNPGA